MKEWKSLLWLMKNVVRDLALVIPKDIHWLFRFI